MHRQVCKIVANADEEASACLDVKSRWVELVTWHSSGHTGFPFDGQ